MGERETTRKGDDRIEQIFWFDGFVVEVYPYAWADRFTDACRELHEKDEAYWIESSSPKYTNNYAKSISSVT